MDLQRFRALPLVGILRGVRAEQIEPLAEVIAAAGLEAVEITLNTEGAVALIARLRAALGERAQVGAGTVLSVAQAEEARAAGARFIVMPVYLAEVVDYCRERGVAVFPGGLTPQEIFQAWRGGATMVKVFPVSCFGARYLTEIRGPFRDIEMLACGGVNADNLAAHFQAGASAAAFGGSVFHADRLARGEYDRIAEDVGKLVRACRAAIGGDAAENQGLER